MFLTKQKSGKNVKRNAANINTVETSLQHLRQEKLKQQKNDFQRDHVTKNTGDRTNR